MVLAVRVAGVELVVGDLRRAAHVAVERVAEAATAERAATATAAAALASEERVACRSAEQRLSVPLPGKSLAPTARAGHHETRHDEYALSEPRFVSETLSL